MILFGVVNLTKHKRKLLLCAIVFLSIVALYKLLDEFYRLTLSSNPLSAIDLQILKNGIQLWFKNASYVKMSSAFYPPATYVTVWPLIGWVSFEIARFVLLLIYIPIIYLICKFFRQYSLVSGNSEAILCMILPLSLNALAVSIGNGQMTPICLALIIYSLLLLKSKSSQSITKEFIISILIVISMIRPSVTVPFFFIILMVFDNKRIFYLSVGLYTIITFISYYLHHNAVPDIVSTTVNTYNTVDEVILYGSDTGGYANLHSLLKYLGLEKFNIPASLVLALILGIYIHRNKSADLWLLLGITAIFARMWVYHKVYDDVLLFIPIITLIRLTGNKYKDIRVRTASLSLLIITVLTMMMPATIFQNIEYYNFIFNCTHIITWLLLLVFLIIVIRINKTAHIINELAQKSST